MAWNELYDFNSMMTGATSTEARVAKLHKMTGQFGMSPSKNQTLEITNVVQFTSSEYKFDIRGYYQRSYIF